MDLNTATNLVELANESGYEFQLHEGYSGRGMYGAETTAITVPSLNEFCTFLYECAHDIGLMQEEGEITAEIRRLQHDNLGLDMIVY